MNLDNAKVKASEVSAWKAVDSKTKEVLRLKQNFSTSNFNLIDALEERQRNV